MKHNLHDRAIALAGIFQAAALVRKVAQQGRTINQDIETSIHSLFMLDADSIDDVYAGTENIRLGLRTLYEQLEGGRKKIRDMELARYVVTLMHLEGKLNKDPAMLNKIQQGIEMANGQAEYFSETHPNVIASLANCYQQTISTLTPRIMVSGEPEILANNENAELIRALLLAGIRSAVLWRQCGGRRFQLLWKRKALLQAAAELISSMPTPENNEQQKDTLH